MLYTEGGLLPKEPNLFKQMRTYSQFLSRAGHRKSEREREKDEDNEIFT